jgi:hypothetical protein
LPRRFAVNIGVFGAECGSVFSVSGKQFLGLEKNRPEFSLSFHPFGLVTMEASFHSGAEKSSWPH